MPGHRVQPVCDSRHGRIACKTFLQAVPLSLLIGQERGRLQSVLRAQSQPLSLAGDRTPKFRFSFRARCLSEHPLGIVICAFGHRMPGGLGQFARQRLGGDHVAGFGRLPVIPPAALRIGAPRKQVSVNGIDKQVSVNGIDIFLGEPEDPALTTQLPLSGGNGGFLNRARNCRSQFFASSG